nr:hypothetical protein [Tanacetum cinerariifolium]
MSWIGLPEFADDTITDYSRPSPSIESNTSDLQNSTSSVSEHGESSESIMSKPMIKFVKAGNSPKIIKTNKVETARKSSVRYAEIYMNTSKSPNGNSYNNIDDKGYWDSGCSRHMTGNIYYLSDYEPYDGGYVSFGQGGGRITGKDFKLKDDTNVLLRTPRQHHMYSIDLNNIVSHKDLTCLVAKASADESMLWHRRLGHLNFKTMNKLVRHNLVKVLPSKYFENDHTCVACLKGKQHEAFCKTKCDNGGEFKNKEMNEFCTRKGIKREFSNARTPQQNGVVERRNKTLIEAAKTMLADAKISGSLMQKGMKVIFIRYSMSSKAFRVFNKRTKKVEENLHVDFLENKLIEKGAGPNWLFDIDTLTSSMNYVPVVVAGTSSTNFSAHLEFSTNNAQDTCNAAAPESSGNFNPTATSKNPPADQMETLTVEYAIPTVSSPVPIACLDDSPETPSDTRLISKGVTSQEETPSLDNILTFSNRFEDILGDTTNTVDTNGVEDDLNYMESKESNNWSCGYSCSNQTQEEPKKIFDALKDPSWVESMQEELLQFKIQNVWILVDCPKGMDVKSTFLCGTIDEEVYVMQPPGFQDPEFPDRVYKVEKAMYGLHQALRAWYGTLSKYLLANGFQRGTIDQTLFIKKHIGDFLLVQVYVDDIIFGSSNPQLCREFKALMHEKFQMSAMGELNFFLSLQVLQKKDDIFLSQDKYVGDILKKFGYADVRSANTPMDKENPWGKDGPGKDVELHLYRSMIGSLMYLTASRPDIMFVVCACARYQVTPKECHLYAVKRIFRYLKGHPKLGLWYPKESLFDLVTYSDSDYGGATKDRKSTTEGC